MSRLRIISGQYGGRLIKAPSGRTTHPMGDRIRLALFNMIEVKGKVVLDAYAGSGAIGLEALSRGAKSADFVDNNRVAQTIIEDNIATLGLQDKAKLYKLSIGRFIDNNQANSPKYDVIFIDPPYHIFKAKTGENWEFSTGSQIKSLLKPNGLMVLSYLGRLRVPTVNGVVVVDKHEYGEAALAVFRLK